MNSYDVVKAATGTGRSFMNNLEDATRMAVEFSVDAIGATPTITYTVQGCPMGRDSSVAGNWVDIAWVTEDATVATSKAGTTATTVSKKTHYIDGLDKRSFGAIGVNVSANTNVTYTVKVFRADRM